jgi:hypothetical protein
MAKKPSNGLPIAFKAFAGNQETRDQLKAWLSSGQFEGLKITGGWDPVEEWGSWGVEFTYSDGSILKLIKKEWLKKGCIAERADAEMS